MKTTTIKTAMLFLGAMMLPVQTSFMGVDLVGDAVAGSPQTKDITVNANVPNNCNFTGGAITLAFGEYDPVGTEATTDKDAATTFTFRCTKGGGAALAMNAGLNGASATGTSRAMTVAGEYLSYEIYSDAGRTSVWGEGAEDVDYVATTSAAQTFDVYGQIPAGQDVSVGTYADTVTITATF